MQDEKGKKSGIHIGQLIQKKMEADGRKTSWLASKIGCNRNNIYQIYQHESLDTEILVKICILLEINLFYPYFEYINKKNRQNATF